MSLEQLAAALLPKNPPPAVTPPAPPPTQRFRSYPEGACATCGMVLTGEFAHRRSLLQPGMCDSCGGDDLDTEVAA